MKKLLSVYTLLIILAGCVKNEKTPQIIEGKVIGVTIYINTEKKQVVTSVGIMDSSGEMHTARISAVEAKKMFEKVESNFQIVELPTYLRIEKGTDEYFWYSVKEKAVLDYDHGTPPCFVFQSDKKIVGYYNY
jgi:uncharacterized lipoprotein YehR (DUF1307 family)